MRWDMAKVIVERPRLGVRTAKGKPKSTRRRRLRESREGDERATESMSWRRHGRFKNFNEHLGPLRRYLRSQLGRPWNKVWSEICEKCPAKNAVLLHVHQHIDHYVIKQVWERDGQLFVPPDRPIDEVLWYRWVTMYVCPRTGLLKEYRRPPRREASRTSRQ